MNQEGFLMIYDLPVKKFFQGALTGPVLITDKLDKLKIEKLRSLTPEIEYIQKQGQEITPEIIAGVQIIFGFVNNNLLKHAKALKWLHLVSAGADRAVNKSLYVNDDIIVTNSAGAYGVSVAEHMLTLILSLLRKIPEFTMLKKEHKWDRSPSVYSVYGSKALILGLGDIGTELARLLSALGAEVTGIKRNPQDIIKPDYIKRICGPDQLDELLAESDIFALCLPATTETEGIISRERISKMKRSAVIVNAGRGSAIDQDALFEALSCNRIAGAGLDVTTPEPLPSDNPLWQLNNLILTPHIAGSADISYTNERVFEIFYRNIRCIKDGIPMENTVDFARGY
jgi:phosphoglycerate dehydrogenase-like enzyme